MAPRGILGTPEEVFRPTVTRDVGSVVTLQRPSPSDRVRDPEVDDSLDPLQGDESRVHRPRVNGEGSSVLVVEVPFDEGPVSSSVRRDRHHTLDVWVGRLLIPTHHRCVDDVRDGVQVVGSGSVVVGHRGPNSVRPLSSSPEVHIPVHVSGERSDTESHLSGPE